MTAKRFAFIALIASLCLTMQEDASYRIQPRRKPIRQPAALEKKPILEPVVLEEKPILEPVILEKKPIIQPVTLETKPVIQPVILEKKPIIQPVTLETKPVIQPVILEKKPILEPVTLEKKPILEPVALEKKPILEPVTLEKRPIIQPEYLAKKILDQAQNLQKKPFGQPENAIKKPVLQVEALEMKPITQAAFMKNVLDINFFLGSNKASVVVRSEAGGDKNPTSLKICLYYKTFDGKLTVDILKGLFNTAMPGLADKIKKRDFADLVSQVIPNSESSDSNSTCNESFDYTRDELRAMNALPAPQGKNYVNIEGTNSFKTTKLI